MNEDGSCFPNLRGVKSSIANTKPRRKRKRSGGKVNIEEQGVAEEEQRRVAVEGDDLVAVEEKEGLCVGEHTQTLEVQSLVVG